MVRQQSSAMRRHLRASSSLISTSAVSSRLNVGHAIPTSAGVRALAAKCSPVASSLHYPFLAARRPQYCAVFVCPVFVSQRTYHYRPEDVINPDEVSFLSADDEGTSTSGQQGAEAHSSTFTTSHASPKKRESGKEEDEDALRAASSSRVPTVYEEVRAVDTFSRARVINFIKRYTANGRRVDEGKDMFLSERLATTEANGNANADEGLFHCCLELPLPHPGAEHGSDGLWAHGVACDEKEAELLAAMHAERIIDALGYCIYNLPSMQRKHAWAARKAGRFAPLPESDDTASTYVAQGISLGHQTSRDSFPAGGAGAFPKPLRLVDTRDETEDGYWQLISLKHGSRYQSSSPGTTLLSPCVLDEKASSRIQLFFRSRGFYFANVLSVTTEPPAQKSDAPFFVASITIPPEWYKVSFSQTQAEPTQEVALIAQGKARVKETAIHLACMHAELLLDAVDIPVFPQDDGKQKEHAMTAWAYGRPAPLCGASPRNPLHVALPLPLKELVPSGKAGKRFSQASAEEELVWRHGVVTSQITDFTETTVGEATALADLQAFLKTTRQPRAENPFFHEVIQGMVKSTVVLPVAAAFGIRGGVGIASRGADANVLAAMHALDTLTALGVPVKKDPAEQAAWLAERTDKVHHKRTLAQIEPSGQSPPGWRLASGAKTFVSMVEITGKDRGGSTSQETTERVSHHGTPSGASPESETAVASSSATAHPARKPRRVAKRAMLHPAPPGDKTSPPTEPQEDLTRNEANEMPCKNAKKMADEVHAALLAVRQRLPRELWSLEADSPDGYIMVAPQRQSSQGEVTFSDDAIRSPRELDPLVKARVQLYLAGMGRRFEDVFFTQYLDGEENGGQGAYRCVAKLPVPHRFGDRVAMGEASTAAEAEQLATMHTELIVDALGICLFNDPRRQKRHAEACAQFGRWAPAGPGEEQPVTTKSPPPLRREYVGSLHWERQQDKKRPRIVSVPRSRSPTSKEMPSLSEDAAPAEAVPNGMVKTEASVSQKSSGEAETCPADDDVLPSMEIDDTAAYVFISEAELDLVSKPRVQYYLRRRGVTALETEYTMVMGRGTILHEAAWTLPLPSGVFASDSCEVKGVATTKRDAEILSWMHAERVLDALDVPIFGNLPKLQQWHREQAAKRGAHALVKPPTILGSAKDVSKMPLPPLPPLRLNSTSVNGTTGAPLVKPVCPDLSKAQTPKDAMDAWSTYTDACAMYAKEKELSAQNAFFALDRVPRTGEALIDETLDEVEEQPINADSKMLLNNYCLAAGTQYPAFWKSQTVGPLMHRVSWSVIPVPGFEYVFAQGVGANKELAQRRAAMHALALLERVDPDYPTYYTKAVSGLTGSDSSAAAKAEEQEEEEFDLETFSVSLIKPGSEDPHGEALGDGFDDGEESMQKLGAGRDVGGTSRKKKAAPPAYSTRLGCFTAEGKIRAIELLTVCMGVRPPLTQQRVQITQGGTAGTSRKVSFTTTVSFTDDEDKRWEASSSVSGRRNSEQCAYDELFTSLDKHMPVFRQIKELLIKDPYLTPRVVPSVMIPAAIKDRIHALLHADSEADGYEASGAEKDDEEEMAVDLERLAAAKRASTAADNGGEHDAEGTRLFSTITLDEAQTRQESQHLLEKHQEKLTTPEYLDNYAKARERLSITSRKDEILRGIEQNPVLIICGTTGCGKTTQVPQFILDHMTNQGKGGACSILITQPRRLSAVSIAQRVAAERLERIGDSTGYAIRFDSRPGKHINFCTSGILLRMLHSSPTLEGINYLVIDEIHERDINSDFLIILLKDLLAKRPDLRVILMSATLQAEQFGQYFDGAPIINVEGYVYPVQEMYLEDLVPLAEEHNFMTPLLKEAARFRQKSSQGSARRDDFLDSEEATGRRHRYGVLEATTDIDYPTIQFAIEQAVRMVDLTSSSILVFLPGWDEITRAKEILERDPKYQVIPLHSSVGQEEQMQCFLPALPGKIKVILSTNIAESGVTIDDIGAVVDVGRAKEKSYITSHGRTNVGAEQSSSVSQLLTVYASRANCVQRRGRVGRTRPGVCIRLYSKAHFDSLHDFQTPEMLRTPLDSLCLQVLSLNLGDPVAFLERALEPPTREHVESALQRLHDLGATTSHGQLTPLGLRLSMLPVEPKMGKVILLGALLRCLDSALTVASVVQGDVFVSARSSREAVRLHKEDLSKDTHSDPLASINGFNLWVTAHYTKPPAEVVTALQERLLSVPQLMTVSRHKRQFHDILKTSGFLAYAEAVGEGGSTGPRHHREIFVDHSALSTDALDVGLVKCVIAAGLFPNVAILEGKRSLRTKLQNCVATSTDSVLHRTALNKIHQPYFVFSELAKSAESSRLSARDLTNVPLWTLLLMGTGRMPISYNQDLSLAFVDEWIPFRISFGTLELVRKLRRALRRALSRAYTSPSDPINAARLEKIRCILKDLVNTPVKPNTRSAEADSLWEETGVLIAPVTQKPRDASPHPGELPKASEEP